MTTYCICKNVTREFLRAHGFDFVAYSDPEAVVSVKTYEFIRKDNGAMTMFLGVMPDGEIVTYHFGSAPTWKMHKKVAELTAAWEAETTAPKKTRDYEIVLVRSGETP